MDKVGGQAVLSPWADLSLIPWFQIMFLNHDLAYLYIIILLIKMLIARRLYHRMSTRKVWCAILNVQSG
jgi:hypothetical protein